MKKIKQIIIKYEDGSYKGYNMNAFEEMIRIKTGDKYGTKKCKNEGCDRMIDARYGLCFKCYTNKMLRMTPRRWN